MYRLYCHKAPHILGLPALNTTKGQGCTQARAAQASTCDPHHICQITAFAIVDWEFINYIFTIGRNSWIPPVCYGNNLLSVSPKTTSWVKKTRHQTLGHNFTNYNPIFKIFFASGPGSKFATNLFLNIPPHFKHVATLPCEIWMSEKWHHSEIHVHITRSHGSVRVL